MKSSKLLVIASLIIISLIACQNTTVIPNTPKLPTEEQPEKRPEIQCAGLEQEAEDGQLFGLMVKLESDRASAGAYVASDNESSVDTVDRATEEHRAEYCFEIEKSGKYKLKTWVAGIDEGSNSFFVKMNKGKSVYYSFADITSQNPYPSFTKDDLKNYLADDPVIFDLQAGKQSLSIYLREDGAELDKLRLELVD